jgi:hypothetical protein
MPDPPTVAVDTPVVGIQALAVDMPVVGIQVVAADILADDMLDVGIAADMPAVGTPGAAVAVQVVAVDTPSVGIRAVAAGKPAVGLGVQLPVFFVLFLQAFVP